jgi:uncharacterized membrane protein
MSAFVRPIAEWSAAGLELIGIGVIAAFALSSLFLGGTLLSRKEARIEGFHKVRQTLGHGILLGLEFLVAADIIRTVAIELTFQSIGVLALIILVRTFLSFTLDVELTGYWPWQKTGRGGEKTLDRE